MTDPVAIPTALVLLDYFGIGVFAVSGALVAARQRLDFVTFVFFAVATGVGGGTLRDLLIGAPVFWINKNATLLICIGAAALVWLLTTRRLSGKALLWAGPLPGPAPGAPNPRWSPVEPNAPGVRTPGRSCEPEVRH